MTVHLTGIFDSECEINLRTALAEIPGVALAKLDMATGEALFTYDPAAAFPATKPDKVVERFDQLLRQASGHLISARPASTTPKEKLKQIELPVVFLHCRACGLALHEMLMKQDGVEQVQIDLKKRTVQATIDPEKATSQQLAAFLKKREVTIKQ
jgi:copper chaperone CopZ